MRAVENESNNSVIRLVAFARDEPIFEVSDARLGHGDRLVLLVKEGRPLEILEPYDMSDPEVANETAQAAADRNSSPNVP